MTRVYYRCALCGKLTRAEGLQHAGEHVIHKRRVVRGLGRGRGFEWDTAPLTEQELRIYRAALKLALLQVEAQLPLEVKENERVYVPERVYPPQRVYAAERIMPARQERALPAREERIYAAERVPVRCVR